MANIGISKCRQRTHSLIVVWNNTTGISGTEQTTTVRWCTVCGAVVVDLDIDNRTNPGYFREMQVPEITKQSGPELT